MDDDTADLVDQLCTRIGMIMEDASAIALSTRRPLDAQRVAAVGELQAVARTIIVLAEAARVLTQLGSGPDKSLAEEAID